MMQYSLLNVAYYQLSFSLRKLNENSQEFRYMTEFDWFKKQWKLVTMEMNRSKTPLAKFSHMFAGSTSVL